MLKSKNSKAELLNKLLYAYIIGNIKAPNEWTLVASYFGLPHYFSSRRAHPHLIEGLVDEVFYHIPRTGFNVSFHLWELCKDFSEFLSDEQQRSLLQYLINKPLYLTEELLCYSQKKN